jgi:hypothetical protein
MKTVRIKHWRHLQQFMCTGGLTAAYLYKKIQSIFEE